MLLFPSEGLQTFDVGTGLSYPAKAERARRNPKVGLLIEGDPSEPIVAIAGHAQVRDTDLQANAERYIAETAHDPEVDVPWEIARNAVWYWTRIIVAITPVRMLWWDNRLAMDSASTPMGRTGGHGLPGDGATSPRGGEQGAPVVAAALATTGAGRHG